MSTVLHEKKPQHSSSARQKAVADALAGAVASLMALWIVYPMDVLKINVQAHPHHVAAAAADDDQLNGKKSRSFVASWFAGLQAKTLHTTANSFCYFYLYSWILSVYQTSRRRQQKGNQRRQKRRIPPTQRLVLSALAAMLNTCLTLPLDVIATRHQTNRSELHHHDAAAAAAGTQLVLEEDGADDSELQLIIDEPPIVKRLHSPNVRNNTISKEYTFETYKKVLLRRLRQWSGLWKGLVPALILAINPSIHHTVFDTVKARYLAQKQASSSGQQQQQQQLTMLEAFGLGLMAKFTATILTYPLIQAKVKLMTASKHNSSNSDGRLWSCLVQEYQQNGIVKGLYRGCNLQLLHTMLKSALLMMLRERIERSTRKWLLVEQANNGPKAPNGRIRE